MLMSATNQRFVFTPKAGGLLPVRRYDFGDLNYSLSATLASSRAAKACCDAHKSPGAGNGAKVFCTSLSCRSL